MEKIKTGIIQHVSRQRREGEEIPFPDCYDEYIGRESTGRIVRFLPNGEIEDVVIEENTETKDEKIKSLVEELSSLVGIETKQEITEIKSKLVTIIHEGGTSEFLIDYNFNIDEYKFELDTKFWSGFTKDIIISEIR